MLITWIVILVIVLLALGILATQPFVAARPWRGERASPQALARHVRMLAETLPERGGDAAKLGVAAEYIHSQFQKHGDPQFQSFDAFGAAGVPDEGFLAIDAGGYHSCGIRLDGTLACWGGIRDGEADAPRAAGHDGQAVVEAKPRGDAHWMVRMARRARSASTPAGARSRNAS